MYEPLHHKYRPQTFAQLVGQGAIADTLTHALEQNRIAPAYLFCGPRGTGKTSSARILAKSLNCLSADSPTPTPCGQCDICRSVSAGSALDIVEIDAASNTGVDNIRELIERAQFAPVQCRYKAYVVDECHMLSTAAFNALLKTLEEPPERVVFVLATTDPQRVLPTIISRCQRFDFRRIPLSAMVKHLSYIAQQESIEIEEAATQLVAQIAQGGLRDAESLLDQLSLRADEITVEAVWDLVGAVPERDLLNLVKAIAADDGTALIERARNLMDKGREPLIVLQSLVGFYRDLLIAKSAPARADMVAVTPPTWAEMVDFSQKLPASELLAGQQKLQTAEVQIKNTTQPRLWLEITLTSLLPSAMGLQTASAAPRTSATDRSVLSIANPPKLAPISNQTSLPQTSLPQTPLPQTSLPKQKSADAPAVQPPRTAQSKTAVQQEERTAVSAQQTEETLSSTPASSRADADSGLSPEPALSEQAEAAESPLEKSAPGESDASDEVAFGSLDDLWAQILATLAPRGTQMLMNQQGSLLAFDGVSAKIGFRSAKLQKMAQDRIPNLEKALEAVFHRPIKVRLEVQQSIQQPVQPSQQGSKPSDNPLSNSLPSHSPPSHSPPSHRGDRPSNPLPSSPPAPPSNPAAPRAQHTPPRPSPSAPIPSKKKAPAANGTTPATAPDRLPSAPPTNATPDQWATNQEQDNIKRFAQFFNGQIVNLDDDDLAEQAKNSSSTGDSSVNRQSQRAKSSDPGSDVPF